MVKTYTKQENEVLLHMREQGVPFKQIAEALGRTEAALWMQYKKLKGENAEKKEEKTDLKVGGVKVAEVNKSAVQETETIDTPFGKYNVSKEDKKEKVPTVIREKEKLTPREMIKSLYDLGYRIEDNKLVCYVRQQVNIKDILQEA